MMRILISGGSGYVGSFLTKELLKQGHEIGIITQSQQEISNVKTFAYNGNIEELKQTFNEFSPQKVIHLAADVSKQTSSESIDRMLSANIILPAYLLQLSEEFNVEKFINISTFSTSVDGTTYSPQTYYAATKKATEDLVAYYSLRTKLDIITLCFYDIYGPNQPHARFLNAVISSIRNEQELHISPGEQEICFLNIHDAVDAMIFALNMNVEKNTINTYCVHGTEVFQLKNIPKILADTLNIACPNIIHDMPYRDVEIMKFSPPHPLLKGWKAKTQLKTEINNII